MAYDGSIKIDTKIDESGFNLGLEGLGSFAKSAVAGLVKTLATVTTALAGLGIVAIKTGSDFEFQMSRVEAISGASGDALDALHQQAKDLGASTSFTAKEVAEGMENLASAGFEANGVTAETNEIMAAMPGLLDLAASGAVDLGLASQVTSNTLRGFGMDASEAGRVADVLARAAADTNAEIADTGEAMKYLAPVAKNAGWSLEESAAAIGMLSDAGIMGGQAGTTLRSVLVKLSKPTKQMNEVMDGLGISIYDADGNMKGMADIIDDLTVATADLTAEERDFAFAMMFGQTGVTGMNVLVEQGSDKLRELTESLENSEGAANDMANTMLDNLQGSVTILKSGLEGLGIEFYESIQEPLKDVADKAIGYVDQISQGFKKGGMLGMVEAVGEVLGDVLVELANFAPKLIEMGVTLLDSLIEGIMGNQSMIADVAVDLITSILNAIITLGDSLYTNGIVLVRRILSGMVSEFPKLSSSLFETLMNIVGALLGSLDVFLDVGVALVVALIQGFTEQFPTLISSLGESFANILYTVVNSIPLLLDAIVEAFPILIQGIIDLVLSLFLTIVEILPSLIDTITLVLVEGIPMLLDGAIQLFNGIVDALPIIIETLIAVLPDLLTAITSFLMESIPTLLESAIELLMAIVTAIPDIVIALAEALPDIIAGIVEWAVGSIPIIVEAAITMFMAILEALPVIITELIAQLPTIVNTIFTSLIESAPIILDAAIQLLFQLIIAIPEIVEALIGALPAIITAIVETIFTWVGDVFQIFTDVLMAIVDAVKSFIPKIKETVSGMGTTILETLSNSWKNIKDIGANFVSGLWEGIKSGIDGLVRKVKEFGSTVLSTVKGVFGIKSPAKELAKIGVFIPPGLTVGIDKAIPEAKRDIDKAMSELMDEASYAVDSHGIDISQKIMGQGQFGVPTVSGTEANPTLAIASEMLMLMREFLPMFGQPMVLDSGEVVGAIARPMDEEFGSMQVARSRGVL